MTGTCFIHATIVGLTLLLTPIAAQGQSSVSPFWIRHAWANESGFSVRPHSISVHNGNVYVSGHAEFFRNGVTFDGFRLDSESNYAFFAHYDSEGEQQWVKTGALDAPDGGMSGIESGFVVAAHDTGIYTSEGYIFVMDAGMLTSGGIALNRYAPDGTHQWTTPIPSPSIQQIDRQPGFVLGLGLDQAGQAYVAGIYRDTLVLAPDTLPPFPLEGPEYIGDIFLAGYTLDGTLRWSRRIGGPRHDVIANGSDPHGPFTVDKDGNTYLGGFFSWGATFGEGQPSEVTLAHDAYGLASFDTDGLLRWVRTARDLGVSGNAGPWRLAVDPRGNLLVDWFMLDTGGINFATVGDTTFTDPGHGGEFLTKIAPDGTLLWARQIESDGDEIVNDITVDARGHVYVAGSFDGMHLRLEGTELRKQDLQTDREDGFVAHYDPEGRLLWTGHAAGPGPTRITAIVADSDGDLYVAGEFYGTLRLGPELLEGKAGTGLDMFVAKYAASSITSAEDRMSIPGLKISSSTFPNPFHGSTTIRYEIPSYGHVRLVVYDLLGREVEVLVEELQSAGTHSVIFEGENLSSGRYIYRLEAGGQVQTVSMVRVR